jgi:hypothetical protein
MKHALALILACCALFTFSGCAKMRGERIEFGHSYPCKLLRGNVYYITYKEDVPRILEWKERAVQSGGCNGQLTEASGFFYKRCSHGATHFLLQEELQPYHEGFFGWF